MPSIAVTNKYSELHESNDEEDASLQGSGAEWPAQPSARRRARRRGRKKADSLAEEEVCQPKTPRSAAADAAEAAEREALAAEAALERKREKRRRNKAARKALAERAAEAEAGAAAKAGGAAERTGQSDAPLLAAQHTMRTGRDVSIYQQLHNDLLEAKNVLMVEGVPEKKQTRLEQGKRFEVTLKMLKRYLPVKVEPEVGDAGQLEEQLAAELKAGTAANTRGEAERTVQLAGHLLAAENTMNSCKGSGSDVNIYQQLYNDILEAKQALMTKGIEVLTPGNMQMRLEQGKRFEVTLNILKKHLAAPEVEPEVGDEEQLLEQLAAELKTGLKQSLEEDDDAAAASATPLSPKSEVSPRQSAYASNRSSADSPTNDLASGWRPQLGDVLILGAGVHPSEFRRCPAVVTKVAQAHCTVVVLDETRRFGIGECWPSFDDVEAECCSWRLNSRVVLSGLNGPRTSHLNGFSGRISAHPKQGHPLFLSKPSDPERPQFTLCVRLDDPVAAGQKSVVLEPRFLTPYAAHVRRVTLDLGLLGESLASLSAPISPQTEDNPQCAPEFQSPRVPDPGDNPESAKSSNR